MYEIITGQAISSESSQEMRYYLNRINMMQDGSWKSIDQNQGQGHFNPIKGFFGEYFGSSRLCVIIFAYRIVKYLPRKTLRTILLKKLSV